jgi:3-dehydroquinate synthase
MAVIRTKANLITISHGSESSAYTVCVTTDAFGGIGKWARESLGDSAAKVVVVSNPTVFALYGERVLESLKRARFRTSSWLMNDGERYKTLRSAEAALKYFSSERLTRDDAVIALGGGVIGDLAGFAAAVYLRGIRFLQVPTTLVAMIDSSVGGKTGVNTELGKNLVGAFHRPSGVLIDVEALRTLPRRELTAGFCEAVKQGAVAGKRLFDQTADYLEQFPLGKAGPDRDALVNLVTAQVGFKASIVRQDESEDPARNDARSRKVLNFGHTFGHALEKLTKYRRFRHGEAVGHGIRFAAELSKNLDLLDPHEVKLLNDVVHRAGRLPSIPDIGPTAFIDAIRSDKKSTVDGPQWVLLKGIGHPTIFSDRDIPRRAVSDALRTILKT